MMQQLTLFPIRGFGLLLPGGILAHDVNAQAPAVCLTRARAVALANLGWFGSPAVVPVDVHPSNGELIYIVRAA